MPLTKQFRLTKQKKFVPLKSLKKMNSDITTEQSQRRPQQRNDDAAAAATATTTESSAIWASSNG